jgi:hypothetical protein
MSVFMGALGLTVFIFSAMVAVGTLQDYENLTKKYGFGFVMIALFISVFLTFFSIIGVLTLLP